MSTQEPKPRRAPEAEREDKTDDKDIQALASEGAAVSNLLRGTNVPFGISVRARAFIADALAKLATLQEQCDNALDAYGNVAAALDRAKGRVAALERLERVPACPGCGIARLDYTPGKEVCPQCICMAALEAQRDELLAACNIAADYHQGADSEVGNMLRAVIAKARATHADEGLHGR